MPWVKLDDQFTDHPKVIAVGPMAAWLYVCGLTYCSRYLTDGFIPAGAVRRLSDLDGVGTLVAALLREGLWESADGGYQVHDYLDYNPSRERALQTREVRAQAGSKGGKQRASNLLESRQALASEHLKQNPTPSRPRPVPVPEPDPTPEGADAPAAPAAREPDYSPRFLRFWQIWSTPPSKGHGSKKRAFDEWRRLKLDRASDELLGEIERGLRAWQASAYWRREGGRFVKHAERWLRDRGWDDEPPDDGPARASPNGVQPARGEDPHRWIAAGDRLVAKETPS